jgi:hypothetical protein
MLGMSTEARATIVEMRVFNRFRIEYKLKELNQDGINDSDIWNLVKKAIIRYQLQTQQFED